MYDHRLHRCEAVQGKMRQPRLWRPRYDAAASTASAARRHGVVREMGEAAGWLNGSASRQVQGAGGPAPDHEDRW
jgi:hypothetical protein